MNECEERLKAEEAPTVRYNFPWVEEPSISYSQQTFGIYPVQGPRG